MNERDVILRERAAYTHGVLDARVLNTRDWNDAFIACRTARFYPLPRITHPRVVEDSERVEWRFVEGRLEFRTMERWFPMLGEKGVDDRYGVALFPTSERIRLWANLLENPTEEVEAE